MGADIRPDGCKAFASDEYMTVEIEDPQGNLDDPDVRKDLTEDLIRDWYSNSQELFYERGDQAGYEVYNVAQATMPPEWDGESWSFAFLRKESIWFEFGTEEHEITPNPPTKMLLFEWPDMPAEVEEKFEDRWSDPDDWLEYPQVMFPRVHHPGTKELKFLRDSRDEL